MLSNVLSRCIRRVGVSATGVNFSLAADPKIEEKKVAVEDRTRINPVLEPDYFGLNNIFTVKEMFQAKVHLGHKEEILDPRMKKFVFGSRLGHIIFDLDITAIHLREALNFCAHIAYRGGIILFVSYNKPCSYMVEKTAKECHEYAFTREWKSGIITQPKNIFGSDIRLPDACVFLNTLNENGSPHNAISEASGSLIPIVAVVDSNSNPDVISYPIPGNDDTPSSVEFFLNVFKIAILKGKQKQKDDQMKKM